MKFACTKCGATKYDHEFRHRYDRNTRDQTCIECRRARERERTKQRMGKIVMRNRRYKYGITELQLVEMIKMQDYRCAACNDPLSDNSRLTHIDHDHKTLRVRGVLCRDCNLMLAYGQDTPARLRAAADYLERTLAREERANGSK